MFIASESVCASESGASDGGGSSCRWSSVSSPLRLSSSGRTDSVASPPGSTTGASGPTTPESGSERLPVPPDSAISRPRRPSGPSTPSWTPTSCAAASSSWFGRLPRQSSALGGSGGSGSGTGGFSCAISVSIRCRAAVPLVATKVSSCCTIVFGSCVRSAEAMFFSSISSRPTSQLPCESVILRPPMVIAVSPLRAALVASPPDSLSSTVVSKVTPLALTATAP